ncbi:hypothetical protein A0H81_07257 [Grifola frondosa]|uniref:Major facilitator superfamily (MFS) profile domain-containing protein n=1 Tax=Grifola frondosa TaxID=5627 RepID=A0A1C7MAL3_GRIFR|nr:hypothetical protein A0H81_07257 [Grifola frondosa]
MSDYEASSVYKSPISARNANSEKIDVDTCSKISEDGNVGLSQFEAAKQADVRVTVAESRKIARKIDIWILPMFCISQGLMDKTALNYGNLYGMKTALHVTGSQFDWIASVFYFGYLIGNYPDGWLLQRFPAGRVFAITTFVWGVIVLITPACTNFGGTLANRFFLGIFEAIVTPGLTILTSTWYTQSEVPLRLLIWYSFNGWLGIFGGFVAYGIGHIKSPAIALWKYIFLILGAVSVFYSVFLWFFFPDSPIQARFLSEEEKVLAIKRVAEAKIGVKNTQVKMYQIKQALLDPKTYLLFVATAAGQTPNGIVSNFSTIIIKGMGFTTLQTTLLDAVSSGVQIVGLLVAGWISTRFKNMRVITMVVGNVPCIIGAAALTYLPADQKWNRLVAYWFTLFQTVGFALSLVMISNNIGGYTKRTFTNAVTFIGFCIGNIIGPQFLIVSEAPKYTTGTKAMFVGYIIKAVAHIALGLYMLWSNVKRDREFGKVITYEDQLKGEEAGMHDLTEFENPIS